MASRQEIPDIGIDAKLAIVQQVMFDDQRIAINKFQ